MTARVLPADVYDALDLSALAFGGIGGGRVKDDCFTPLCAAGHARFLDSGKANGRAGVVRDTLDAVFVGDDFVVGVNDRAVAAINRRKGAPSYARVTFEEWSQELNVVRGE